jgi:hypothetical protein
VEVTMAEEEEAKAEEVKAERCLGACTATMDAVAPPTAIVGAAAGASTGDILGTVTNPVAIDDELAIATPVVGVSHTTEAFLCFLCVNHSRGFIFLISDHHCNTSVVVCSELGTGTGNVSTPIKMANSVDHDQVTSPPPPPLPVDDNCSTCLITSLRYMSGEMLEERSNALAMGVLSRRLGVGFVLAVAVAVAATGGAAVVVVGKLPFCSDEEGGE